MPADQRYAVVIVTSSNLSAAASSLWTSRGRTNRPVARTRTLRESLAFVCGELPPRIKKAYVKATKSPQSVSLALRFGRFAHTSQLSTTATSLTVVTGRDEPSLVDPTTATFLEVILLLPRTTTSTIRVATVAGFSRRMKMMAGSSTLISGRQLIAAYALYVRKTASRATEYHTVALFSKA